MTSNAYRNKHAAFTTERQAERIGTFNNAVGAIWLAAIGGAITHGDAERLHRELTRAADRVVWAHLHGETTH
jgi:hypothetical protein